MKKVLLIVVDACASRVFTPALEQGRLPNVRALCDAGTLRTASTAVFPSITPAATSSIVTGRYPCEHGIAGAHWYNEDEDTVVYYGPDFWVIVDKGVSNFFEDLLIHLNHDRLRADTLFQTIERAGYTSACLNYLMFRGDSLHSVNMPILMKLLPGLSSSLEVYGPSILYWGDLITTHFDSVELTLSAQSGPQNRFGFTDVATAELLVRMAELRLLPDFTLAYFPDNDFVSHDVGPENAVTTLEALDEKLGAVIDALGGLESMLDEFCLILTGDHAQTPVVEDEEVASIALHELLMAFELAPPGQPWSNTHDLLVCPNLRSAQIYLHHQDEALAERITEMLLADRRVDQVIWQADTITPGQRGFYVVTQHRGRLHFWAGTDAPNRATDEYGGIWCWDGDLAAVDARVSDDGMIEFTTYPNAFERIACGVGLERAGNLWVTAQPGHEFRLEHTVLHAGGGSHGSLHKDDSESPLLVAGAPSDITLPASPRSVDVAPLCLRVLGIEPAHVVGASHVSTK